MILKAAISILLLFNLLPKQLHKDERYKMVEEQIIDRGVRDPLVIDAMRKVPRHEFVPSELVPFAYSDQPLPIGNEQTISQPYIVAYMTEALHLQPGNKVLEIGTGSGYQAAVLAEIVSEVVSIEIVEPLAIEASKRLLKLGYTNIKVISGDGYKGSPKDAPFDAIIVTAAPNHIPPDLIVQLKEGGRMIIPVGEIYSVQHLMLIEKKENKIIKKNLIPVRFVPFTREPDK